jgi:hypothetical protein
MEFLALFSKFPRANQVILTVGLVATLLSPARARAVDAQTAQQKLEAEKSSLEQQIHAKNQNLSCAGDGNCESMPMGEKPCGGPSTYLIYSTSNMYAPELQKLVARYTEVEKRVNNGSMNIVSTCSSLVEPDPRCEKDRCVDHAPASQAAASAAAAPPAPDSEATPAILPALGPAAAKMSNKKAPSFNQTGFGNGN